MSRDYTVTADTDATGAFREEWLSGNVRGKGYLLEKGVGTATITLNVMHQDRWVRETIDLAPMLEAWVTDLHKDLKKEMKHDGRGLDD